MHRGVSATRCVCVPIELRAIGVVCRVFTIADVRSNSSFPTAVTNRNRVFSTYRTITACVRPLIVVEHFPRAPLSPRADVRLSFFLLLVKKKKKRVDFAFRRDLRFFWKTHLERDAKSQNTAWTASEAPCLFGISFIRHRRVTENDQTKKKIRYW